MSQSPQPSLAVTLSLLHCASNTGFQFREDTALVAVQHMLLQTVDLFKTIANMGLNVTNIFVLGKVYSNNSAVIELLREMGVTVVETTVPEPGEYQHSFNRDVERLWQVVIASLVQRHIKRILILDDAGVCITRVPADILRHYSVCGVEQTSQGMFVFAEQPPPFAVMSWARAKVKLEIGGPIFSRCFIDKMNSEFLRGGTTADKQIGIIGLGSIGKAIARLAERQFDRVLFYDPDPAIPTPQSSHERISRVDSLEELMLLCDYVVGCSGRNPFKDRWPMPHKPGISLLSASGGDQEFGPIIRDLRRKHDFKVAPDSWDITSDNGPSGRMTIAYRGCPYNFVSRAPEAVPSQIVQLETAGLLAGLIQARIYLDLFETGLEPNSGIHRVSPAAQRFVYERWLGTMKEQGVNLADLFAYDPETLAAAEHDAWFNAKTEPHPGPLYQPVQTLEERMADFISKR